MVVKNLKVFDITQKNTMSTIIKSFTITKKVAKHGKQSVIVIPTFLASELKPKTIVEVKINVLKEADTSHES